MFCCRSFILACLLHFYGVYSVIWFGVSFFLQCVVLWLLGRYVDVAYLPLFICVNFASFVFFPVLVFFFFEHCIFWFWTYCCGLFVLPFGVLPFFCGGGGYGYVFCFVLFSMYLYVTFLFSSKWLECIEDVCVCFHCFVVDTYC